jgi:hypothetical protein
MAGGRVRRISSCRAHGARKRGRCFEEVLITSL